MIIVVNSKKTLLVTSIGLCFIGSFFAALKLFYGSRKKRAVSHQATSSSASAASKSGRAGKLKGGEAQRQNSSKQSSASGSSSGRVRTERSVLLESIARQDNINNLAAEELLELGMNYLNQAIKSWETALDSIESAVYMQSRTLALPTDEHADLVFKLRSLLDKANEINLQNTVKLIKSSRALQIIQSRLAYKQQLYTEALLKSNSVNNVNLAESVSGYELLSKLPGECSSAANYLSEDDNESFVSADSEFDWIDESMFQRIENVNDKNALYEMAFSNANLGRVPYRVSRCEMFNCKSETDFAAKLHVVRLGFDRFLQDSSKRHWFVEQGRGLITRLWQQLDKEPTAILKAYEDLVAYCTAEGNGKLLKDEMATRDVTVVNFYDVCLDFILIDAFEDLEQPPSAIVAVIQNRWLSQSFKETALETAVWSILKAKRKLLKFPNGMISKFYSLNECLVPVLAWGFLGTDADLNRRCLFMKNHIVEYLRCLFDHNRTRYTNLEELSADFEAHSRKYLQEILDHLSDE